MVLGMGTYGDVTLEVSLNDGESRIPQDVYMFTRPVRVDKHRYSPVDIRSISITPGSS